jgi:DNA-directed RNA polymerase specialized sigma24 family protein
MPGRHECESATMIGSRTTFPPARGGLRASLNAGPRGRRERRSPSTSLLVLAVVARLYLVNQLPERQRVAIRSRVVDGRGYAEMARELECSELVVRQQVSRGLKRLRDELTEGER